MTILNARNIDEQDEQVLRSTLAQWSEVKTRDLPHLNTMLREANVPPISLEERSPAPTE